MTLDELIVRIRVAADGTDGELDSVLDDLKRFASEAEKSTKNSADAQAAAWAGLSAAAGLAFGKIMGAVQTGIDASNQYKASVMGLESVAKAHGISSDAMQAALDGVTDKFFNATAASTAFKNLLSRGYTLDQAIDTITRLKDSAAFGRQASYGLADAVVSATEGIKNENSILVDNAGVTKNVAKMWEDYAKARGVATTSLTQAQKVEAEYLGIMEETKAQVGDLSKLSEGLAGAQAEASNQSELMAKSFGEAMTPLVETGTEVFTGILSGITGITEAAPGATAGITTMAGSMAGLISVAAGLKTIQAMFSKIGLLSSTLGPLAGVAAALGLVAAAYTALTKAQEKAKEAEEQRKQAVRDAVVEEENRLDTLRVLRDRYNELYSKSSRTVSENAEMAAIIAKLADSYGIEAGAVNDAAAAHERLNAAMADAEVKTLEDLYSKQNDATWESIKAAKEATQGIFDNIDRALDYKTKAKEDPSRYNVTSAGDIVQRTAPRNSKKAQSEWTDLIHEAVAALESANLPVTFEKVMDKVIEIQQAKIGESEALFDQWIGDHWDQMMTGMALKDIEIPPEIADKMKVALQEAFGPEQLGKFEAFGGIEDAIRASLTSIAEVMQNSEVRDAVQGLTENLEMAKQGFSVDPDEVNENWNMIFSKDSPLMTALLEIPGMSEGVATSIIELAFGFEGLGLSADKAAEGLRGTADTFLETETAAGRTVQAFDWLNSSSKAATAQAKLLLQQYDNESKALENLQADMSTLEKGQKALTKAKKDNAKLSDQEQADLKAIGKLVGYEGDNYDVLQSKIDQYGATLESQITSSIGILEGLTAELSNAAASSKIDASVQVECSAAVSNLQGLITVAKAALAILSALGLANGDMGKTPSGGGGGKKDDAEAAARAAEQARKEAIQRDYDYIAHKRHMNEITLEEELKMLQRIRKEHQLTAQEIMDWEEKVYDLKKEIRDRDAGSIDKMGDAIIEALAARYEAMLDTEIERLDASRKAWEDWRDGSVKAINDQIAALDKLMQTEDREKQDAEELRKIAKLKQDIEFEQDEYNRMKLQQQLQQAMESRAERLRRLDIEDQKEALRAEITAIEEKADAEITALDAEQEAIEAAYEERLKAAALRAEAEKLIMKGNQKELIALIGEFAPEYDALGKTLGEKLLDGFQGKVGDVVKWFQQLNDKLYSIQEAAAADAIAASEAMYNGYQKRSSISTSTEPPTTIVNQTVNFNEPVETPSQTARRIAEVNEALAQEIMGGV